MSISTGYGFRPVQLLGGKAFSGGTIREFVVTPASASHGIYNGDLVTTAAGVVLSVATAPAAGTLSTNTPVGVAVGVRYTDPVLKQTQHANFLPANSTGYANIYAKVVDDPDVLFQVRADTANLTYTSIGQNCTLATYVEGSTTNGASKCYVTGIATTNTLPFRIVDVLASSTDGSTYTDVIVKYNWNTHAYHLPTGQ